MTETVDIDAIEGDELDAYIAERTVLATVEQAEAAPDLQDAVRQSGARQIDAFSFATNEGTVILASPADVARMNLFSGIRVDRRRPWGQPGYLGASQHALPGRGK